MKISITISREGLRIRRGGFTVAELMVVVVIIVLLASAMGGYYVGTYRRMMVETAAKEIMLAAKYARLIAIEKQSSCRLILDETEKSFCLMRRSFGEGTDEIEKAVVSNSYTKPGRLEGDVVFEKVQVASAAGTNAGSREGQSRVVFRPDGTADTAVIQVGDGKPKLTLVLRAIRQLT
jgi:prepilin-type N-terminal cleavage/methylation domain-containing protein